jgi:hypothetical protein
MRMGRIVKEEMVGEGEWERKRRRGREDRWKNRREEYSIRYNSIIYNNSSKHKHHPPEPNTTQIKLHHSRHPSDNLCGVRLF